VEGQQFSARKGRSAELKLPLLPGFWSLSGAPLDTRLTRNALAVV